MAWRRSLSLLPQKISTRPRVVLNPLYTAQMVHAKRPATSDAVSTTTATATATAIAIATATAITNTTTLLSVPTTTAQLRVYS